MTRAEQIGKALKDAADALDRALPRVGFACSHDMRPVWRADLLLARDAARSALSLPPDPAPGMDEIERLVGVVAMWAFKNGHSGYNHPQYGTARAALLTAIRALAAPGADPSQPEGTGCPVTCGCAKCGNTGWVVVDHRIGKCAPCGTCRAPAGRQP